MADKKISQMTPTTTIGDTDLLTSVQGGINKYITGANAKLAFDKSRQITLPPVTLRADLRVIQTISGSGLAALPTGVTIRVIGINSGVDEVPNNFVFTSGATGTDDNLNKIVSTDGGGVWDAEIPTIATGEIDGTFIEEASATRSGVVTAITQTFAGIKSFLNQVCIGTSDPQFLSSLTLSKATNHKVTIVSATAGEVNALKFANSGNTNSPFIEWQFNPSSTDLESYLGCNYSGLSTYVDIIKIYGNRIITTKPLTVNNLKLETNTISSIDTNGDVNITPNGTGILKTDNLGFYANTISSIDTNGNINLSPNGAGKIYANNPFLHKVNIITKDVDYTVQGNESGSVFNNYGAGITIRFTLPDPGTIKGHHYWFHKTDTASATIEVYDGTLVHGSATTGAFAYFYYDGTRWNAAYLSGTWIPY